MRSIIKYPGSKFRIAKQIISYFPEHRTYLEPFFGSGAILFNKDRSPIETINDLDQDVVCFFEWVKNDPEKLAHEIAFTPYARKIYENACTEIPTDSLQQAVSFVSG
ncbi:MAG: DNA adenine methylase [Lachnospiraceae bacterium]